MSVEYDTDHFDTEPASFLLRLRSDFRELIRDGAIELQWSQNRLLRKCLEDHLSGFIKKRLKEKTNARIKRRDR